MESSCCGVCKRKECYQYTLGGDCIRMNPRKCHGGDIV